jgi:predicted DNA-binding protein YlxM (UPF0122 family)
MLREVTAGYDISEQTDKAIFHNTKELLELYSKVSWRINSSLREIDQEYRENTNRKLIDLIDSLVDIDPRVNEERLNSRLRSIEDSKSILDFIDLSLLQLKEFPEGGKEYHDILNSIYINRTAKSIERIAEEHGVSRSTIYRERNKAINMFGVILWGFIFDDLKG